MPFHFILFYLEATVISKYSIGNRVDFSSPDSARKLPGNLFQGVRMEKDNWNQWYSSHTECGVDGGHLDTGHSLIFLCKYFHMESNAWEKPQIFFSTSHVLSRACFRSFFILQHTKALDFFSTNGLCETSFLI